MIENKFDYRVILKFFLSTDLLEKHFSFRRVYLGKKNVGCYPEVSFAAALTFNGGAALVE